MNFKVAPGAESLQIVPLALQTVVENALKHNTYSASTPMKLSIYTDQDQLVIENTLNRRPNTPSTQTGLDSLRTRVEYICRKPLQIAENSQLFSVRLPLVTAA